jgi:hypothetical protein
MGPETKIYYDGEGQRQFDRPLANRDFRKKLTETVHFARGSVIEWGGVGFTWIWKHNNLSLVTLCRKII